MPFVAVKTFLWIALGGALSFAGLRPSFTAVALAVGVAALLALWLVRHPTEIRQAFAHRRSKGEKYIRESGKPWKKPPSPNIVTGLMLVVGAACLWSVFSSPTAPRGILRRMLYSILSPQGSIVLAAMLAAFFLCTAAEHALGAHWSREA